MIKISDQDFLRIDKLEFNNSSYLQRKINELQEMPLLYGLFWKILISPSYVIHSFRQPKLKITQLNKEFLKSRMRMNNNPFCIRTKFPIVFDSLARVIILDEQRINKKGQRYQNLRNELNKAKKLGYTTKIFQGDSAIAMLDKFYQVTKNRNWRNDTRYFCSKNEYNIFACAGFNSKNEITAMNAVLVSNSYAYMFYYYSIEKKNIRWLLSEHLVEHVYNHGVKVFHTDNLLDVSTGSFVFQKEMGYKTVQLKFI